MIALLHASPAFVECGTCHYARRVHGKTWCIWCLRDLARIGATLAHNLAIAAALCAAFWDGWDEREHHDLYSAHGYRTEQDWRPGCGKRAP